MHCHDIFIPVNTNEFDTSNQREFARENDNFKDDATSVTVNDDNIVVSVTAEDDHKLLYRVGIVDPVEKTFDFGDNTMFTTGKNPRISINNNNQVVAVWENRNGGDLYCRYGTIETNDKGEITKKIEWGAPGHNYTTGLFPSVVLLDDGTVVEDHTSWKSVIQPTQLTKQRSLYSTIGKINTATESVEFDSSNKYDTGIRTSVAAFMGTDNNIHIISAHENNTTNIHSLLRDTNKRLFYNTGVINEADADSPLF